MSMIRGRLDQSGGNNFEDAASYPDVEEHG